MAILHKATLTPSKPELIAAYLPTVSGFQVTAGAIDHLGAYRFDDPAGDVGIESHLVTVADGRTLHLPLTYRNEPLASADDWFVGTLEHSVLGTRYVYDAVADPVYVTELVRTILTGGEQVPLVVHLPDGGTIERDNTVFVNGTGTASTIPAISIGGATREGAVTAIDLGGVSVIVRHAPRPGVSGSKVLVGTWPGAGRPAVLAELLA
ncbi:MAG: hypothetical protein AAGC53_21480 [Actinomycetota bacterium]